MKEKNKTSNFPKLLIISSARWGKDTFGEILRDNFDFKFNSSSQAAADIFIYEALRKKYDYKTSIECFQDRMNHRAEWFNLICEYNETDKARLAKDILKNSDGYVGMRDADEIEESKRQNLFDLIIWIDASKRLPAESFDSFNIDISHADIIVDNNGTLEQFTNRVIRLGKILSNYGKNKEI